MSKPVKLPPTVKSRSILKPGKGWRLVNPKRSGSLKAQVVVTFSSAGDQYVIFRVRD
jgi:hypothetical protein